MKAAEAAESAERSRKAAPHTSRLARTGVGTRYSLGMEPAEPTTDPPARSPARSPGPHAGVRCLNCDYLLDGLPTSVCPECGRPFDPDDPGTYFPPWFRSRLAHRLSRRWAAPPSILHMVCCVSLLHLATWPVPGAPRFAFDPLDFLAAGVAATGLTLAWILRRQAVGWWGDLQGNGPRLTRWKWRLGPMCLLLLCLSWVIGPWCSPAFLVSYPFLRHKAETVLAKGTAENHDQFVGLLWTRRVAAVGRGVKFNLGSRHSLIYDPTGEECRSRHVSRGFGNWCWREY